MSGIRLDHRQLFALLAIFIVVLSMSNQSVKANPGWSWFINYEFDKASYQPDSSGTVSMTISNRGDVRLHIKQAGIQFEWQSSDTWWAVSTNVYIDPGQQTSLGSVTFKIPSGTGDGTYKFQVGVDQEHIEYYIDPVTGLYSSYWKSDGAQMADDYGQIKIEKPKALLTYVSVTGIPSFGSPIYVGDTSRTIAVISNTGNAKALAVRVALEELSPATGLVVSGPETKDIDPLGSEQWVVETRAELPGTYRGKLRTYSGDVRLLEQDWELVASAPEIVIATKDVSPQANQVFVGDTITITYTLRNTSPAAATQIVLDVIASDGLTILERPNLSEIGAQSDAKPVVKVRADKVGSFSVELKVSLYGAVVQQDRVTVTVQERPLWQQPWFLPVVGLAVVGAVVAVVMLRRRGPKAGASLTQPVTMPSTPSTTCPNCGKMMTYVEARSQWYCTRCKEYF